MWRHQQFDLMKPFSLKCCQQHPNPKIVCQPETSQRKYSWIILWYLISTGCSFNNLVSTIRLPCVPNPVDHAWPFFLPDPSSAPAFFRLFLHVQSLGLVRHDFFLLNLIHKILIGQIYLMGLMELGKSSWWNMWASSNAPTHFRPHTSAGTCRERKCFNMIQKDWYWVWQQGFSYLIWATLWLM